MAAVTSTVRVDYNLFPQLPKATRDAAIRELNASALRVAADAARRTPPRVDTGAMMRGYRVTTPANRPLERTVYNEQPYHVYQELGTSTIAPHPMLLPAAEAERPRYDKALAKALVAAWAGVR